MNKQPPVKIDINALKMKLLVHEAKRWVGFTESGGDNRGQVVEAFQKAVDGRAVGEAWCLAFNFYCVKMVDNLVKEIFPRHVIPPHGLEETEHCLTCWYKSPSRFQMRAPKPGRIVIWRHGQTTQGHAGIIVSVDKDGEHIYCIEGNTGPSDSSVQREGDGVYFKRRNIRGHGKMKVVGYLQPW